MSICVRLVSWLHPCFRLLAGTEKGIKDTERKPLWENAITIAPHAHSQFPQNFVALHGMGVGRYMEWACGATWNGRVAQPADWSWTNEKGCHTPIHVAPQSFVEWACGAIAIAASQLKLARFSFYVFKFFILCLAGASETLSSHQHCIQHWC